MLSLIRVRCAAVALAIVAALSPMATTSVTAATAAPTTAETKPHHPPMTKFTFVVSTCEGCAIQLYQAVSNTAQVWRSGSQTVTHGKVSFIIPTRRTLELNAAVSAPWDGDLGYVTDVVFGYPGQKTGSVISMNQAVRHQKAGGCWTGTTKRAVTMALSIAEVTVQGPKAKAHGTLAWATRTQDWRQPIFKATDGVLGSPKVLVCQPT